MTEVGKDGNWVKSGETSLLARGKTESEAGRGCIWSP